MAAHARRKLAVAGSSTPRCASVLSRLTIARMYWTVGVTARKHSVEYSYQACFARMDSIELFG